MQKNCVTEKQSYFSRHFLSTLMVISFTFLCPDITLSATKYYYYLQTGSFRIKQDAIKFIKENMQNEKLYGKPLKFKNDIQKQ